jgi:hypothetical protein
MESVFRDILLIAAGAESDLVINADYADQMVRVARKAGISKASELIYKAETARNDIVMNVNVQYALKNIMLREM